MRRFVEAFSRWAAVLVPGLLLLLVAGIFLPPLPSWSRLAALVALAWVVGTAVWKLSPAFARLPLSAYALELESRAGLQRSEISNALSLSLQIERIGDPFTRALARRAIESGTGVLRGLDLRALHPSEPAAPHLARAGAALAAGLILALMLPAQVGDSFRLFLAAGSDSVIPEFSMEVEPGSLTVPRGSSIEVRARLRGRRLPPDVRLRMRTTGTAWVEAPMRAAEPGSTGVQVFEAVLASLQGDIEYCVETSWKRSEAYTIRVLERLQAAGYRKHYEPPAYTGLPAEDRTASNGDLAGLRGTKVTLEVLHRRKGIKGSLMFYDLPRSGSLGTARAVSMELEPISPGVLALSFDLHRTTAYQVELRDPEQGDVWRSDTFHVEVLDDLPPAIKVLEPSEAIDVPPGMKVGLEVDCVDDFGLRDLALVFQRPGEDLQRIELARWEDEKEARVSYQWDIEEAGLLPGETLYYYLVLYDNDAIGGPKKTETPLRTIRFPALSEMYAKAEEERRQEIASLEEMLNGQKSLEEELKRVAQEMLREKDISWEKQQEIQDLLERQEALSEKIESLRQSIEASRQRMENQSVFSMELLEKVREIQQIARQIQSPEFHELIKKMRQALESMDKRKLQEAMQQMKVTQQEIAQALDRTLRMLRDLLAREKLDRLVEQINSIAMDQKLINEELEMGLEPPEADPGRDSRAGADSMGLSPMREAKLEGAEKEALERQQRELIERLEELQEKAEQLSKEAPEDLQQLRKQLEDLLEDPSLKEALERMQQAASSMQQGSRQQALHFGKRAGKQLAVLQGKFNSMQQQIDVAEAEAVARSLYDIAYRMAAASKMQEQLYADRRMVRSHEAAVLQRELHDEISAVADSLAKAASRTKYITREHFRALGDVLHAIERAMKRFEQGGITTAFKEVRNSMASLNEASRRLLEAASQAQSSCSSSCPNPFNQMQSLTGQQSDLNQKTKELLGLSQVPRQEMGQEQAMLRLAARQEMIKKGLEEIREQLESSGKLMGDLESITKEMEEVVKQLRKRKADRRIIKRQEKILSRLLSAQRSIRRQDETEERESRPGMEPPRRQSPGWVDVGSSPAETLRRALVRGSRDPIPAEYRRLVEVYLRRLMSLPAQ